MSSDRVALRLHDIIENIDSIIEYRGDCSFDALYAEPIRVDAIERCLQRITEPLPPLRETCARALGEREV